MKIKLCESNLYEKALIEISKLVQNSDEFRGKVYAVGGCVRDKLLGDPIHDIDLVVNKPNGGIDFAQYAALETDSWKQDTNPVVFKTYGTAKFNIRSISAIADIDIECVQTRKERYDDKSSRNPTVVFGTVYEDALRRDLTINALYLDLTTMEVLDPTGMGLNDIKNHVIQCPNDPNIIFEDDPLRILRVIRFATRFGWGIDKDTWLGMVTNANRVKILSRERVTDEITKILMCKTPSVGLNRLKNCGVMDYVLPEIKALSYIEQGKEHFGNVYVHTMSVVDKCLKNRLVRWAALYHDIGKLETLSYGFNGEPHFYCHETAGSRRTMEILKEYKFSNADAKRIATIVKEHMRFKQFGTKNISKKTIKKFLNDNNAEDIPMILAVIDADNNSHAKGYNLINQVNRIKEAIKEVREKENTEKEVFKLPITGKDVMEAFHLKSGPTIGSLMRYARDICLETPSITKEECLERLKVRLTV